VILVSHDMHLLSLVADRLWLVSGGKVQPFDGDLDAYRSFLLSSDDKPSTPKPAAPKRPKPSRDEVAALRSDVRKCEARVEKLEDMRGKLATKLADPELYEPARSGDLAVWNRKYAEVMEALDRAEAMWLAAQDALDKAQADVDA
jgi:ATP-binding cassette subfamily F protein 3